MRRMFQKATYTAQQKYLFVKQKLNVNVKAITNIRNNSSVFSHIDFTRSACSYFLAHILTATQVYLATHFSIFSFFFILPTDQHHIRYQLT